ncbi:hypothetical protein AVEN_176582-1 [Araneus ventricosus]|uniref:Uncharacterized protein n=1 Tax=Araneus ventricosus TaxID=182803 RepID=A0A4Y2IAI5_ARAVE|nr:hypothetical protein AVEN_176582-1 [Araneus ventricosus]
MFPQNVAAIAQTLGLLEPGPYFSGPLEWNRVPLLSKVEPQYSLRVFVGFGSPRKDGRNCISLCRKDAALVRDGYKRYFFLSFFVVSFYSHKSYKQGNSPVRKGFLG